MNTSQVLWVIAWRNLWRNTRRTLLTAATISGGLALLLVFFGLEDGLHRQMLHNAVQLGGAHVAVQARGYQERRAIELTLSADVADSVAATLARAGLGGARVVPRLYASGLASSADGSSGINLVGVLPHAEAPVSLLDDKLVAGRFFPDTARNVVVIGEGVARKLHLAPGNKCVLMVQGPGSSEIQSLLVRVAGIMATGAEDLDQTAVLVPLGTAQALLGLPGRIHQAAVILDEGETGRAAQLTRARGVGELEVLSWQELMPSLHEFIANDEAGLFIIDTIFFLIISFLVANTLLISVLERRREFALLDAVGLTPTRRFMLIMLEATWIGLLSLVVGGAGGFAGHAYFRYRGLDLRFFFSDSGWSAAGTAVDTVIYSALSAGHALLGLGLVFLLTVALALLPAWRAATGADAHLLGQT